VNRRRTIRKTATEKRQRNNFLGDQLSGVAGLTPNRRRLNATQTQLGNVLFFNMRLLYQCAWAKNCVVEKYLTGQLFRLAGCVS